jgi:UDP-glucose 4-epimerase
MTAMETATPELAGAGGLDTGKARAEHESAWSVAQGAPVTRELELTLWIVLALAGVAIAVGALVQPHTASHLAFGLAAVALGCALAVLRTVAILTPAVLRYRSPWKRARVRVAVVGSVTSAADLAAALTAGGAGGVEVMGAISPAGSTGAAGLALGGLDDARRIVEAHGLDVVLVGAGVSRQRVIDIVMRTCEGTDVRVCDVAEFYEDVFGHVPLTDVDSTWFQHLLHPQFHERRSQRIVDIVVAVAMLLACLPLLCAAALLIRRDGGRVLFRQTRIGRDGRPFVMYKLRTMHPGEESTGWTQDGDPRVTGVGRILRRVHLDELPQLVNVLRGDMTLVGPRPEQPDIVAGLEQELELWRGRHRYRPGLTGWAQVRCGYAGSHDGSARKLAHDLFYLRHHSLVLDAAIIVQTARLLVVPRTETVAPAPFLAPGRDEAHIVPVLGPAQDRRRRPRIAETRAIVTGGAGFIGSQLVDGLLDRGHAVTAVDDLSAGVPENLAQALADDARLETANVTDADAMLRLFTAVRPHVVFHLAAQIEVTRAVDDPLNDATANVVGTLAVLEAARACGARRFVLASSGGAVYGDASVIPTPEHAALVPLSPYGAAKLAAEHYTSLYGRLYGLSTMSLRLANVYGPRQGLGGEGGVIARFCRARVNGVPAKVFGDGLQTRDYIHVHDVVAAFIAAGSNTSTGALNIGTRTETTVLDLVRELGLIAEFRPERPGEVGRSCLDASAATRVLGWRPRVALERGLAETLAFARDTSGRGEVAV